MAKETEFDYIIVGAGTAGCCLAERLSADGFNTVLLIEDGRDDDRDLTADPSPPNLRRLWKNWNYSTDYPIKPRDAAAVRWRGLSRGTMVGGCSSTNAVIHIRGAPQDFDEWGRANPGWSYSDVLPYFKRSETYKGEANGYRGSSGPVSVRLRPKPSAAAEGFLTAAATLGFAGGPGADLNAPPLSDKAGYYQYAINDDGTRCSSASAFLSPEVRARSNLTIKTDHKALRLQIRARDGGRAEVGGVVCLRKDIGFQVEFTCNKEVLLCGGTIGSAHLMLLSGIGLEADLRIAGINPVRQLPVGHNLHDHLIYLMRLEAKQQLSSPDVISEASLYIKLDPAKARNGDCGHVPGGWPNVQYFAHAGISAFKPLHVPPNYLVMAPTLTRPKSRGQLRLLSGDPRIWPEIDPNYFGDPDDLDVFLGSIELTRELSAHHTEVKPQGYSEIPGPNESRNDKIARIRFEARGLWHPVGTCKMGPEDDPTAVVDHELKVHGVDRLRVCDASIMPEVVCANSNPAVLMIAEKAADMILM